MNTVTYSACFSVSIHELRETVSTEHSDLKQRELENMPKASHGYGGKFGVQEDRMDKVRAFSQPFSSLSLLVCLFQLVSSCPDVVTHKHTIKKYLHYCSFSSSVPSMFYHLLIEQHCGYTED